MIILKIFNVKNLKNNVFIIKFNNNRKKTFNIFVVFITTILICKMIIFIIAIAYYSSFVDDI